MAEARGLLGQLWHWLVMSETLHAGYAVFMFAGLLLLAPGFVGRGRTWWMVALAIQTWHLFEHLLLYAQVQTGLHLLRRPVQTGVVQLFFLRVELHLFYNGVVTVPMIIAIVLHLRAQEGVSPRCTCSRRQLRIEPALA